MQNLAYLILGSSITVLLMMAVPRIMINKELNTQKLDIESSGASEVGTPQSNMNMQSMSDMADNMLSHDHPSLEISIELPIPSVTHLMFPDAMDGYNIQILTRNFKFTPADINKPPQPNTGHAHIYVNDMKVARVYSNWFHLPSSELKSGENFIRVTLNANNHSEWSNQSEVISSTVRVVN